MHTNSANAQYLREYQCHEDCRRREFYLFVKEQDKGQACFVHELFNLMRLVLLSELTSFFYEDSDTGLHAEFVTGLKTFVFVKLHSDPFLQFDIAACYFFAQQSVKQFLTTSIGERAAAVFNLFAQYSNPPLEDLCTGESEYNIFLNSALYLNNDWTLD